MPGTTLTTRVRRSRARSSAVEDAAAPYEKVGLELSLGTQASDRMVGEPTTFTKAWFDAFPEAVDAAPLLARARALKTEQEIQRMRLADEIAAAAMEHVAAELAPGMKESEAAALWEGFVHGEGTGWKGQVELAIGFSLVWSGPGIRTFTATGHRFVQETEPTLFEIWVCADGYWCDHTKNVCPGTLDPRYNQLLDVLLDVYGRALDHCRPGAAFPTSTSSSVQGSTTPGTPAAVASDRPRRRCACTRAAVRASAGTGTIEEGMVLAVGPGASRRAAAVYGSGQLLVAADGAEKLSGSPDDSDDLLDRRAQRPHRFTAEVGFYDTTLRDGEQTVGVVLTPEDKLELARGLDALGIERIEAGFPRVSKDDWRAVELIRDRGLERRGVGFLARGRGRRQGSRRARRRCERDRVADLGPEAPGAGRRS